MPETALETEPVIQQQQATVFIVDDDERVLKSIRWEMQSVGYRVETFSSANSFLAAYNPELTGCLILDVRMPAMSGLELQEVLQKRRWEIPVIMISGHGDVPVAVQAMKHNAVDFLCKPVSGQVLLDVVNKAISIDVDRRKRQNDYAEIRTRLGKLTPREREVLDCVVLGMTSKGIADRLGVHYKTIEAHRANISRKMKATNAVHLISMVKDAQNWREEMS